MKLKDVSFWCVVLAITTAMTIQYVMSSNIIEGIEDSPPEIKINIVKRNDESKIRELTDENERLRNELKNKGTVLSDISSEALKEDTTENDIPNELPETIPENTPNLRIELNADDYNKHYYEINTCDKNGKDPPSENDCESSLDRTWFNKGVHRYDEYKGIHTWIVPRTGSYIIEAGGGTGGTIKDDEENDIVVSPGKGAIMKGIFYLKKNEEYNIIIGQNGTKPTSDRANPWNGGSGGGGGTFMWRKGSNQPLIVAGGGGGQGITGHKILGYGGDGSVDVSGKMGPLIKRHFDIPDPTNLVPNFGRNGEGGGDPSLPLKKSKGWENILKNEDMNGVSNIFQSESGFGGGGILNIHAGGGGGGYSGGGSKKYGYSESNTMGGGGGGSYFSEDGFKREDSLTLNFNEENGGYLKIEYIREYFFYPGTKHRCIDVGGYEPESEEECRIAAEKLGLEYKTGPRENGWNNEGCKSGYSRCIWRNEDQPEVIMTGCEKKNVDKGLIYNKKCNGMKDYEPNIIEETYKTICVSPWKREKDLELV